MQAAPHEGYIDTLDSMVIDPKPKHKQVILTLRFLLSLLHYQAPFTFLPKIGLLRDCKPVGLKTSQGEFPASTASPLEAHTSQKAKAQGHPRTLAGAGGGAQDQQVTKLSLISSLPLQRVRAVNQSRQLICHLELVHFCPFTNPSHLCPGTNVKCNNCIADLKNNSLDLFMNACCGH